ncbi:prepilin-type N-terminal cleavage/methylation domain-containing protein [Candidatus Falkowbacteria bacterium]|nr:prepilin-type N-terminal cleavage/methylation domain-containing protein [Candidatus Falkowbacteria bacterium]
MIKRIFQLRSRQAGFTLIELLVVIAIIGLLSTLAVVALNNARQKSRDAKRVSDIKQIQTALELYFNDENGYPANITAGSPITGPNSGVTYMAIVPTNPSPQTDGNCPTGGYTYSQADSSTYSITYCLGGVAGGVTAGTHRATPAGLVND